MTNTQSREVIRKSAARAWRGLVKTVSWLLSAIDKVVHPDEDYDHIVKVLDKRTDALKHAMDKLKSSLQGRNADQSDHSPQADPLLSDQAIYRLATVDLFVEKAQRVLTRRARRMSWYGLGASLTAVATLALLSYFIATHSRSGHIDQNELILRVVSAISLGGIVLVAVKYLIALARSFFHEGITLLSRRHALRFGRMYLYLNYEDVELDHLLEAFDWNRGGESSFLDIKPGEIAQTPYTALATAMGEGFAKGLEAAAPTSAPTRLRKPASPVLQIPRSRRPRREPANGSSR